MAKYKAYPEYKDSGVEWLGEVPAHWLIKKLKYLCKVQTGSRDTVNAVENGRYPFFVRSQTIERINSVGAECEAVLTAGDGVGVGKVYHYYDGKFDFHQRVYMLNEFHSITGKFVYYYLSSNFYKVALEGNAKSTVDSLRLPQFLNFEFSIPNLDEQKNLILFIEHETAKIDNLIEKQHQLIELMKEKRQAVISHAVTKGLNSDVPMKNSGVEWLGEVPEHWKLIKFNHCVSIRSGQVDPRKSPYCDYWLIAPNHIVSGEGRIINLETAKDQGADSGKYLCRTGEVIYSKIRPALVKACLSPSDTVLCSADMYPMSSYNGLTNNFLLLYLLSDAFTRFAVNQADRVAMPKINRESLSDCKIPVPPIEEQEKIYSHARETLEKLDILLQESQLTIELLRERRTALISAAVTGKIDVRDWVAPDAQDVEESQEATA